MANKAQNPDEGTNVAVETTPAENPVVSFFDALKIDNRTDNDVAKDVVKRGGILLKDCHIGSVNAVVREGQNSFVSNNITFDNAKFHALRDGKLVQSSTIDPSFLSVLAALRKNDDVAFMISELENDLQKYMTILSGAVVDVLYEHVPAHKDYVNPFSDTGNVHNYDDDKIFYYIINIRLKEENKKALQQKRDNIILALWLVIVASVAFGLPMLLFFVVFLIIVAKQVKEK